MVRLRFPLTLETDAELTLGMTRKWWELHLHQHWRTELHGLHLYADDETVVVAILTDPKGWRCDTPTTSTKVKCPFRSSPPLRGEACRT